MLSAQCINGVTSAYPATSLQPRVHPNTIASWLIQSAAERSMHRCRESYRPRHSRLSSQTSCRLEGPHRDAIDPLQKRIDREPNRSRHAQNVHVAISRLPVELLSDVFLYVVESGLRNDDTCFSAGTFNFLQVCRRWNEVAVAFPRLWVWWIEKAGKAWHLFNARSGDAPLFLTWRNQFIPPERDAFMDAEAPRKIRRLDFYSDREELELLLGVLDANSVSVTSSIQIFTLCGKCGENLTRFLSLPFPKLSELDIANFLPDLSSPIFTTSNLTSLKLHLREDDEGRYTQLQFSQILRQHPKLRELNLREGAIPLAEEAGAPVSVTLPQLVELRLDGSGAAIAGLVDLVRTSPLHNVAIRFQHTHLSDVMDLVSTMEQILTTYYECQRLEYPRKVDHLSVSLRHEVVISARSSSGLTCHPTYSLDLQSYDTRIALVGEAILLFPPEHIRVFVAAGVNLCACKWRVLLRNMKGLSHLQLDRLDAGSVLDSLHFDDEGVYEGAAELYLVTHIRVSTAEPYLPSAPKLQSLSLRDLEIPPGRDRKLLNFLRGRLNHHIGLKSLVIQLCRVPTGGYREELKDLVEEVTWAGVKIG